MPRPHTGLGDLKGLIKLQPSGVYVNSPFYFISCLAFYFNNCISSTLCSLDVGATVIVHDFMPCRYLLGCDCVRAIQVALLSQRDRAAGWVSNGQKLKTGTERQYLRTV